MKSHVVDAAVLERHGGLRLVVVLAALSSAVVLEVVRHVARHLGELDAHGASIGLAGLAAFRCRARSGVALPLLLLAQQIPAADARLAVVGEVVQVVGDDARLARVL